MEKLYVDFKQKKTRSKKKKQSKSVSGESQRESIKYEEKKNTQNKQR